VVLEVGVSVSLFLQILKYSTNWYVEISVKMSSFPFINICLWRTLQLDTISLYIVLSYAVSFSYIFIRFQLLLEWKFRTEVIV